MTGSIIDRPPLFTELFEPELLQELCQRFSGLYDVGLRAFDAAHAQLVDVSAGPSLMNELFRHPETKRALIDFISRLKRFEVESDGFAVHCDPVAATRYLIVPVVYEFEVIGKLICGPYRNAQAQPLTASPFASHFDVNAVARLRTALPTYDDDRLRALLGLLTDAISTGCHAGYRALLTSHMHLESITEAYNDLQEANRQLRERNEALAANNARLKELDQLKSNFLATVSHELRTPLTSVIGYSEMLLEGLAGPLNDEQREYISTIMERGENLLQLIGGILDISKIERGAQTLICERITADALVESALSTVRPQARKGELTLVADLAADLPVLYVDRYKIRQSLVNLLSNAVKFTHPGGTITVRVNRCPRPRGARPSGPSRLDAVRFAVIDTGVGLPPNELEKVFEAFYQVDNTSTRKYGGTGLGLSIVKNFIEAHGGEVRVTSEQGVGSTFEFIVPIEPDAPE
ncbi:MAG: PocR ligand-binding domain-containing protein [Myxococcales bacterium]|nr:PocR ligand-binding domain-containing protein [Myxococcales bacterium]